MAPSQLTIVPLSDLSSGVLSTLFSEEKEQWTRRLKWDYGESLQIVCQMIDLRCLSGYAAFMDGRPVGYTFYVEENRTGLIGGCFVARQFEGFGVEPLLLGRAIEALKSNAGIDRIESAFVNFGNWSIASFFTAQGFLKYQRYLMMRQCLTFDPQRPQARVEVKAWTSANLPVAAELTHSAYRQVVDREMSVHYQSVEGCYGFLTGLVLRPGCGTFLEDASFCAYEVPSGRFVGFVITSLVSTGHGHIPQIVVSPEMQGKGIGAALLNRAFSVLTSKGLQVVSLSVSEQNGPAVNLYRRLGFEPLLPFQAFVWNRERGTG